MKIKYTLLVILLIIAAVITSRVTADAEEGVAGTNNGAVSANGSDGRVNETADLTKKSNAIKLDNNDSKGELDLKEKELKKGTASDLRVEGSSSELKKESEAGGSPPVREKCDSSSNHCTDDEKMLVACLRVPGNESPSLSLLIQNKGKGSQSITISAPDSVQLERARIVLLENEDTEVKVSIRDVENGHFIVLTAGHGDCTLDFKDEFEGRKMDGHTPSFSKLSISTRVTLSKGVVLLGGLGLVIVGVSVLMCTKSGRKYFAKKDPKYQRLDMEILPVSRGSNPMAGGNEGWDNSWGDNWDDEEALIAPVTPTVKFKEGWKD